MNKNRLIRVFIRNFKDNIFSINASNFESAALALFDFQFSQNEIYRSYCEEIRIKKTEVNSISKIPFLPIEFFKTHKVVSVKEKEKIVFESSGTTGEVRSKHYVFDPEFYLQNAENIFNQFYGDLKSYRFLTLLPSYAERNNSSLVYMMDHFMKKSIEPNPNYYLYNHKELREEIENSLNKNQKFILWGVTFGLLDFFDNHEINLQNNIILETGGMKGRKKEMIRAEVHQILKEKAKLINISSEYGMTELLSQGYALENGHFKTPAWLKIILREATDPFSKSDEIKRGGINVIDLANIESCAFIETKDLGAKVDANYHEILGRFDNSDVRGCNLMAI